MRALVVAASKHGATAGIAAAIADTLRGRGVIPVSAEPDDVRDLDDIDAVVLGSAVYAGHWLRPAMSLVERLGDELAARPVWLFSSGPVGDPPKPSEAPADAAVMVEAAHARGHHLFAGKLDRASLGIGERAVVRVPARRRATSATGPKSRRGRMRSPTPSAPARARARAATARRRRRGR